MEQSDNKKIPFSEFKAWLQGVEEMQSDDWSPSKVQWDKIKQKLNQVDITINTQHVPQDNTIGQRNIVPPPNRPQFAAPARVESQPTEFYDGPSVLATPGAGPGSNPIYSTPFK